MPVPVRPAHSGPNKTTATKPRFRTWLRGSLHPIMLINPWHYRGGMRTLPRSADWAGEVPSLYILQFPDRCKVGISANPPDRLKALHSTHRQTCGAGVLMAAISTPTAHAYSVEQSLLRQFGVLRLAGEYLAVDFETLSSAATHELKRAKKLRASSPAQPPATDPPKLNLGDSMPVRELAPRVLRLEAGPHPFAVEWNLHDSALRVSGWQTLRRYFKAHADAVRFCLHMWQIWLATLSATGIERDRVLGLA